MNVELLAPAGNFEKLKTALYFGADAVYLGGKHFSLRTFADNFTSQELKEATSLAHPGLRMRRYHSGVRKRERRNTIKRGVEVEPSIVVYSVRIFDLKLLIYFFFFWRRFFFVF